MNWEAEYYMKRMFGVVNMITLLLFMSLFMGFMSYTEKEQQELAQLRLSYQIDLSTDAAVQEMLRTGTLNTDYTQKGYITVNPKLALDAFLNTFCLGYDLGISEANKTLIRTNYIPMAAVAGYDGYYIATQKLVKNSVDYPEGAVKDGDWDLAFGPKMPYTYKSGGASYALNMGGSSMYRMQGNLLTKTSIFPTNVLTGVAMTKNEEFIEINKILSEEMSYALDKANETNGNWANSFFIPVELTSFTGVNPIKGPSFMVLVQNLDLTTRKPINAFSVGGSRIDSSRTIVGYTRAGIKYYSYSDKAPAIPAEAVFNTMSEAAKAGYSFDTKYME